MKFNEKVFKKIQKKFKKQQNLKKIKKNQEHIYAATKSLMPKHSQVFRLSLK